MSDWRDTFERFHDICNQEETRHVNTGPADRIGAKLDAVERALIWDEAVRTALDHAIRNDDGITLRLERPNPYATDRPLTTAEWLAATDDVLRDRCWVLPRVDSDGRPVEPGVPQPGSAFYTPNTDQVRSAYVRAMRNAFIASAGEHEQEFDRWLAVTPAIIAAVEAAMIEHGPDGHTDGAEQIAEAAIAALRGNARDV